MKCKFRKFKSYPHSSKNSCKIIFMIIFCALVELDQTSLSANLCCNLENILTYFSLNIKLLANPKSAALQTIIINFYTYFQTYIIMWKTGCREYRNLLTSSNAKSKPRNVIKMLAALKNKPLKISNLFIVSIADIPV